MSDRFQTQKIEMMTLKCKRRGALENQLRGKVVTFIDQDQRAVITL